MLKKWIKNKWTYIALALLLIAAVMALLPKQRDGSGVEVVEEILTGTAERGQMATVLIHGGSIADTGTQTISLAGDVEIKEWQVRIGDYVEKGQLLATVDKNSVLSAIAQVNALMEQLDAAIESSRSDTIDSAIYAPTSGRVKAVFVQSGQSVMDAMYENAALMLLSLDGKMAVDIQAGELTPGETVTVTLSDDTELEGLVGRVSDGIATITVPDDNAAYDDSVKITGENGKALGSGRLYIHSQLKICGYSGTVSAVHVALDTQVSSGQSLLSLTDTGYTGEHDQLLEQRRKLEEQMQSLFAAYQSGGVYAEDAGCISQIIEEGSTSALAAAGDSGTITLLGYHENRSDTSSGAVISLLTDQRLDRTTDTELDEGPDDASEPTQEPEPDPDGEDPDQQQVIRYMGQVTEIRELGDDDTELVVTLADGNVISLTSAQLEGKTGVLAANEIQVGDVLVINYSQEGELLSVTVYQSGNGEKEDGVSDECSLGGMGDMNGMTSSGSMGGTGSAQTEEPDYTMEETALCTFALYDSAEISLTVDELDIAKLSLGQCVSINLDALPGESFEGRITAIDPEGSNEGGSSKYAVTVTMPRTEQMLAGMNASVTVELENRENVLAIPLAAICEDSSGIYVYTGYDEKTQQFTGPVAVTTGLSDGENVEILSGLEEGDSFCYSYSSSLKYTFSR